jgi:hypothetical protein
LLLDLPNACSHFVLCRAIRFGARQPPATASFHLLLGSVPGNRRRTRRAGYHESLWISIDLIDRLGTQQVEIERGKMTI